MAVYTLVASTGTFTLTGKAPTMLGGLYPAAGVFQLNPPRNVSQIALPPAIGTQLFWKRADGAYYVVINQS